MAKIKSSTDLEQSKKLAEILPLESADMCCFINQDGSCNYYGFAYIQSNKAANPIPCWSLTALLGVIPYNITFNKAVYLFKLVKFSDHWECYHENFGSVSTEIFKADNPVDACYEMILKLYELKML